MQLTPSLLIESVSLSNNIVGSIYKHLVQEG